ncbi:hypothetical protein PYS58_10540 [Chryseobacterium indologenes]|uniref:hypothetical protein n=1 Tax=Chryseobacterium indologenes TaxID=253 RepID=UPI0023E7C5D7|nr:hypothetical protein [Chryseobacterium indologenes]WET51564.1 hypothetical protein PYS58_10540 [Chryseobacterium indologenes]
MKKLKRNELKNIAGGETCFCLVSPDACYELNVNNQGTPYVFNCCTLQCEQQ